MTESVLRQPQENQNDKSNATPLSGYASINRLEMYYEIHGSPRPGAPQPLILLYGSLSAIGTSFGAVLPALVQQRQVIAVDFQAHGRTADIDRPLTIRHLADDIAAFIQQLNIRQADFLGYSMGAGVALQVAIQYPQLVRKLVTVSLTYTVAGFHPGLLEGIAGLQPEHLAGSPFQEEYARIAPRPADWPRLIAKIKEMDLSLEDWPAEDLRSLKAPTLLVIGDSDIVRPEHAVEMFRLLGGGVAGDTAGLPRSQLAILPGTTHITVMHRAGWLVPMVDEFLNAPVPA